jgi:midasin
MFRTITPPPPPPPPPTPHPPPPTPHPSQLLFIVSDGRCLGAEQKKRVRSQMQRAQAHGQLPVFIMLDQCVPSADGAAAQPSILSEKSVAFVAGKPVITAAIDSFPFPYYLIVSDLSQLPQRLADALRQWFEAGRSAL